MYMLSEHPTVLSRLREEVLRIVGPDQPPTLEQIPELKFLRAVINGARDPRPVPPCTDSCSTETLRLYPPVAANMKKPVNATVFPSKNTEQPDIFVPAGIESVQVRSLALDGSTDYVASISYSVSLMHRRKDLWGPDGACSRQDANAGSGSTHSIQLQLWSSTQIDGLTTD